MSFKIVETTDQHIALVQLPTSYSIRQIMEERVKEDNDFLWDLSLATRTAFLEGGYSEGRYRFKIDHEFDFLDIGSFSAEDYAASKGTEFVIVESFELENATLRYAIRADKLEGMERMKKKPHLLSAQKRVPKEKLAESRVFRLDKSLTLEEVINSEGWLELAVGKNNATPEDYRKAKQLLMEYFEKIRGRNDLYRSSVGMPLVFPYKRYSADTVSIGDIINQSRAVVYGYNNQRCWTMAVECPEPK